jgi:hypothetical protein
MGGKNPKSKIVAILCVTCHDRIDNGTDWGNGVNKFAGGGEQYVAFDLHGNTLIERSLSKEESDGADGGSAADLGVQLEDREEPLGESVLLARSDAGGSGGMGASSPLLTHEEESDGAGRNRTRNPKGVSDGQGDRSAEAADVASAVSGDIRGDGGAEHRPSPLTHEQRVAIAQEIKDSEWQRQWRAGDTGNQWIAELGEEAEQYLSDFGYVQESLANILRVCAAIKPAFRYGNLRFSHHVVVYDQPPEVRMDWLAECEIGGWSVAEFRRQVKGTKPKVKRWTLEELGVKWCEWTHEGFMPHQEDCESCQPFHEFRAWLGEQG